MISGFTVKIPDNLLVEFPALFVPFAEFCGGQKAGPNEVTVGSSTLYRNIELTRYLDRLPATLLVM